MIIALFTLILIAIVAHAVCLWRLTRVVTQAFAPTSEEIRYLAPVGRALLRYRLKARLQKGA